MTDQELYNEALRYRQAVEKMYWLINSNTQCECEFKDNWTELMDKGIPGTSPRLRKRGFICMFCKSEDIYSEAIGEELFLEQTAIRIDMFLERGKIIRDPNSRRRPDKKGILSKDEKIAFENLQRMIEKPDEE